MTSPRQASGVGPYQAAVTPDVLRHTVQIRMVSSDVRGMRYLTGMVADPTGGRGATWSEFVEDGAAPPDGVAVDVVLDEFMAYTLHAALDQYFGGPASDRQLRDDHRAERARVDKLTDALIQVVTR